MSATKPTDSLVIEINERTNAAMSQLTTTQAIKQNKNQSSQSSEESYGSDLSPDLLQKCIEELCSPDEEGVEKVDPNDLEYNVATGTYKYKKSLGLVTCDAISIPVALPGQPPISRVHQS